MRPIIGITGNRTPLQNDPNYAPFDTTYIPHAFATSVKAAGGIPIIIPLIKDEDLSEVLSIIDGLVLTGGQDINPMLYQEEPVLQLGPLSPERDEHEMVLIEQALKAKKPILGICRGMQLLNVVLGGSLYQDLSLCQGIEVQHVQKSEVEWVTHSIKVAEESILSQFMKSGDYVNTLHHQAIKDLGQGLKATAWSSDNLIEAVEAVDVHQSLIGVQWHPECTYHNNQASRNLFKNLVDRAKDYQANK